MSVLKYNPKYDLNPIIEQLNKGEIIVYPTDTIYGIGVTINNTDSIKKVFELKKRSLDKPLSVCFHDVKQMENYVFLNDNQRKIVEKLLPGSYTLLLNKKDTISPIVTSDSSVVGVRIPDNEISHKLTKYFPITSTSANVSGCVTPDNIQDIQKQLQDNIDIYIDIGKLENTKPSTIIDLTKDKPLIIREGLCNKNILRDILHIKL